MTTQNKVGLALLMFSLVLSLLVFAGQVEPLFIAYAKNDFREASEVFVSFGCWLTPVVLFFALPGIILMLQRKSN